MPTGSVARKLQLTKGQRSPRTRNNMKHTLGMVIAALAIASPAAAQTMYRCLDLGRTIYSDQPCLNGDEVRQIAPNGNPTADYLTRLRMTSRRSGVDGAL